MAYVFVQGNEAVTFENVVLTTADARSINVNGENTGIDSIRTTVQKNVYDLSGRKVKADQKGIVIIDGQKVLQTK